MLGKKKTRGTAKRKASASCYHRDFAPPTASERTAALGTFPGAPHAARTRAGMIAGSATVHHLLDRPSLSVARGRRTTAADPAGTQGEVEEETSSVEEALSDLDDPRLYVPVGKSDTKLAVPKPRDELDWLAQVPEEGQTFDEYVRFLTSRSGRVRPIANAGGEDIVLLPIIDADGGGGWPAHGPPLDRLAGYARAFFDRRVRVLPPATVRAGGGAGSGTTVASASASGGRFAISFPAAGGGASPACRIAGRSDPRAGRAQLRVGPLLERLAAFREGRGRVARGDPSLSSGSFCVVGVTMVDLLDGPADLFCAGMAYGGSKVAVFSFHRYHPHLKMHPLRWHDYGYGAKADPHSYYEDDQDPDGLAPEPPGWDDMTEAGCVEMCRRAGKLLTHELGHLFGLDHCIHHRCLMMGTGHLVEDFAAPSHLCGVCLRKLQWRLGFRVAGRYALLGDAFRSMGMGAEGRWVRRQADALSLTPTREKGNARKRRKVSR